MKHIFATSLLLALTQSAALAEDIMDRPSNWMVSAEIGAISTSGNTSGTSVSGKFEVLQDLPLWSNEYTGSGFFKEDRTEVDGAEYRQRSAQRYRLGAKAGYKLLEEHAKFYSLASFEEDQFGVYKRVAKVGVGYGSRWYGTEDKSLDMEFGPGYFNGERASGEQEQTMIVRGAAAFRWKLSPSASFAQVVTVERGRFNTQATSETSLSTRINGSMQMKAAFSARNDTNVPADKQNTDTQTSVTLVYSF